MLDKKSPWYSTPAELRNRPPVRLSLSHEEHDALDELAQLLEVSRSRLVGRLLLAELALRQRRPRR